VGCGPGASLSRGKDGVEDGSSEGADGRGGEDQQGSANVRMPVATSIPIRFVDKRQSWDVVPPHLPGRQIPRMRPEPKRHRHSRHIRICGV